MLFFGQIPYSSVDFTLQDSACILFLSRNSCVVVKIQSDRHRFKSWCCLLLAEPQRFVYLENGDDDCVTGHKVSTNIPRGGAQNPAPAVTNPRTSTAYSYVEPEERFCFSIRVKNCGLFPFAPIQGSCKQPIYIAQLVACLRSMLEALHLSSPPLHSGLWWHILIILVLRR